MYEHIANIIYISNLHVLGFMNMSYIYMYVHTCLTTERYCSLFGEIIFGFRWLF